MHYIFCSLPLDSGCSQHHDVVRRSESVSVVGAGVRDIIMIDGVAAVVDVYDATRPHARRRCNPVRR